MNPEKTQADMDREAKNAAAEHASSGPPIASREFVRRARAVVFKWPSTLDAQMKQNPYSTFGIAFAVGMGTGVLLGSRILRSVVSSVVAYAAVELGRTYLKTVAGAAQAGG